MNMAFKGFHFETHGHFFPEGLYAIGFILLLISCFVWVNKYQEKTTLDWKNKSFSEIAKNN